MKRIPRVWRPICLGAGIGLVCACLAFAGAFATWNARIMDRLFLPHAADPRISIVAIDDTSIVQLGRWPWARSVHAELIRRLSAAGARVIAYDVNFPELSNVEDDQALADALKAAGTVVLPVELQLQERNGVLTFEPATALPPAAIFAANAGAVGQATLPPDEDSVLRWYPMQVQSRSGEVVRSFVTEALRLFGKTDAANGAPMDRLGRIRINYPGHPMEGFRTIHAADVIRGTADLSALAGGAVFVGSTATDLHDNVQVPTSDGLPMPGIEVHASAFDTILQRHWLMDIPTWATFLLLIVLGALAGLIAAGLKTRWALPVLGFLLLGVAVTSFFAFDTGLVLDLGWPLLTLLLAYGIASIERRLSADADRRQVKQAFSRYVSKSVVKSILQDPSKLRLGGERRQMTVLFSDIRGFTSISEKLDPDALVHVLNIYLSRMTDIVFAHDGVLDKYIGDAVMAFWNAPLPQPDHAKRAIETALDMQEALVEMSKAKAFGDVTIGIGVGVNTGDVVVGNIGGQQRFEYTVIGDSVNLASRLEALTRQYNVGIIVTDAVRAELGEGFLMRRLDKVAVKGKQEPVMICEVMARTGKAEAWQTKLATDFEAALDAYFKKDFVGAATRCHDILSTRPEDGPSKLLLERAEHFQAESPVEAWDGTWVYTKK